MITRTPAAQATSIPPKSAGFRPTWPKALQDAVRSLEDLLSLLELSPESVGACRQAAGQFPLVAPRGFVARMAKGDPDDPLLRQILPSRAELLAAPGYTADPLCEEKVSPTPGILHKYKGRALIVTTGACAVHCRYCFRRHFPYAEHPGNLSSAIDYLASTPTVSEVILSGGDPLSLSDEKLTRLVDRLEQIPHIRRLRLHTRLPIVLPERVDDHLLRWLESTSLQKVLVVHSNHGNEIDSNVRSALSALKSTGATLLNQSVLLRNVNDQVDILRTLSEALFQAGVLPYYLHVLDRVEGAAHFEVPEEEAKRLIRQLLAELPGYLVPKLVKEIAGAPSKTPISLSGA